MNPNPPSTNEQPGLLAGLRALPRAAWILFFGTFLNKFGSFVMPFLILYMTGQGYSVTQAGIAAGAYGVGGLFASLLGGHLADNFGRRPTIVLSMFLGAITMMLLWYAHGFVAIVVFTAFAGLANEFYRPAASALLTDIVPQAQRVTAFATLRMAFNAGFAFGPAMAGLLAAYGYFWLFAGDALTSVLFGLVAMVALPSGVHSHQNKMGWGKAWQVLRHDRRLHRMVAANLAIGLVFHQFASTYGLHVKAEGFSAKAYGALLSFNGALIVFFELPMTTITRRFPARRVMAVGYLIIGIGFALNYFAHSIPALALCMAIFTLGEMVTMPMVSAYVANLAPADMRGRYLRVSSLAWSLSVILGPGLGMNLFTFSPVLYWLACGVVSLFAAIIILVPVRSPMSGESQ